MATKIKITNATSTATEITVEYEVTEDGITIATGSKKYSAQCTEEHIEKHLAFILDSGSYQTEEQTEEEKTLDAAAITAESLQNREIIKNDRKTNQQNQHRKHHHDRHHHQANQQTTIGNDNAHR